MGSLDGRVANTHPAAQKRVLDAGSMVADKLSPSIAPPPVMRCRHVTMPSFRVVICPLSPWVCTQAMNVLLVDSGSLSVLAACGSHETHCFIQQARDVRAPRCPQSTEMFTHPWLKSSAT